MHWKFEDYRQGAKLTRVTCQGAKPYYAILNDCKSCFGRGMNLISMSVELCIRNLKFTSGGATDEGHVSGGETLLRDF